jgi:hypothetical protein
MFDAGPAAPMAEPIAAPRRVRRRRRWPWVLLVVAALLAVVLIVADRVAVGMADTAVEKRLAEQAPFDAGNNKPHVSINGVPFLTQAVSGKYDDIEVAGDALRIEQVSGIVLDAHMHGVHVPLSKAVSGHVASLPIDRVDASVGIPFAEAARLTGIRGLTLSAGQQGALHVSVPVTVPGSTAAVTASADAAVSISGNRLSYAVRQITVDGIAVPPEVTSAVAAQMNGAFTVPPLPYHLRITGVTAMASGVRVTAAVQHIVVDANS